MITKWKLFNFKSIRNETTLELSPLTIFAGANSSGKSSVLQSMLMISQTLASRVDSRSVILNGPLVRLGQFDDLRSFGSEANQILIGWEITPTAEDDTLPPKGWFLRSLRRNILELECEISFDADPALGQSELSQLAPHLFGCNVEISSEGEDGIEKKSLISVARSGPSSEKLKELMVEEPDERLRRSLDFDVHFDQESLGEMQESLTSVEPAGISFRHFLPARVTLRYDEQELKAATISSGIAELMGRSVSFHREIDLDANIPQSVLELLRREIGDELFQAVLPEYFQPNLFDLEGHRAFSLKDWVSGVRKLNPIERRKISRIFQDERESPLTEQIRNLVLAETEQKFTLRTGGLPSIVADGIRYLEFALANTVKYLGPLRDEPKPLYPLATSIDPSNIGLKGEFTAAVLNLNKERKIVYLSSSNFSAPEIRTDSITRSLEAAVLDWLQYMGVAEQISALDKGKLGHELKVTTSGTNIPQDLTHVGVGVSQVVPILVMCLVAEPDTTIVIEQPELHLHPKVQTLLADFFLSTAMLGKQIIVETHSEYIINRLRFRAAAAQEDTISRLLQIYFVDKKDGASVFRTVDVNKYGAITDWPDGFFDQSQTEAEEILRAATLKRKKEKGVKQDAQRHD